MASGCTGIIGEEATDDGVTLTLDLDLLLIGRLRVEDEDDDTLSCEGMLVDTTVLGVCKRRVSPTLAGAVTVRDFVWRGVRVRDGWDLVGEAVFVVDTFVTGVNSIPPLVVEDNV